MRRTAALAGLVALLLPLLAACGGGGGTGKVQLAPPESLAPAIREAPLKVQEAYRFALMNEEVLRYIPCYCGCGGVGHTSNYDCFVDEVRPDGTVVFDDMGLG